MPLEQATFGGGCFWCMEAVFTRIPGIVKSVSGYAGGTTQDPTYEDVCRGDTGHAEVIQITFDPAEIRFDDCLKIFWESHDPTTVNRQGNDVGTQYRSVIFTHDEAQHKAALASLQELETSQKYNNPIVTKIEPLLEFYPAEEYHQDYFTKHPNVPYCASVIQPKLVKLSNLFKE